MGYNKGKNNPMKRPEVLAKFIGKNNPFYGHKHSKKTKSEISISRTGKCMGKDNPMFGSHRTGKNAPFYGHHHTQQAKKKCGLAMKGKCHTEKTKKIIGKRMTGKKNPMYGVAPWCKGKERPEQSIKLKGRKRPDLTKRLEEGLSVYASSFIKNPSKPQVSLYRHIKKIYPFKKFGTTLNYPEEIRHDKHFSLDVAVPDLMVDYEYDEPHWHDETKDLFRDEALMEKGWAIARIRKNDLKYILKNKGSGWHGDRIRHSNARRFGRG